MWWPNAGCCCKSQEQQTTFETESLLEVSKGTPALHANTRMAISPPLGAGQQIPVHVLQGSVSHQTHVRPSLTLLHRAQYQPGALGCSAHFPCSIPFPPAAFPHWWCSLQTDGGQGDLPEQNYKPRYGALVLGQDLRSQHAHCLASASSIAIKIKGPLRVTAKKRALSSYYIG